MAYTVSEGFVPPTENRSRTSSLIPVTSSVCTPVVDTEIAEPKVVQLVSSTFLYWTATSREAPEINAKTSTANTAESPPRGNVGLYWYTPAPKRMKY